MATLMSSVTTNGAQAGASHTGDATVFVHGTFDGATVTLQVSDDNVTYVKADNISTPNPARFDAPGAITISAKGTYHIRCVVNNVGASTSLNSVSTQ